MAWILPTWVSGIGRAVEECWWATWQRVNLILMRIQIFDEDRNASSIFSKIQLDWAIVKNHRKYVQGVRLLKNSSDIFILDSQDDGLAIQRLAPYRSNVLIVDECRPWPFLDLPFLLHISRTILFMGDNEQTLHFDETNWTRHFK